MDRFTHCLFMAGLRGNSYLSFDSLSSFIKEMRLYLGFDSDADSVKLAKERLAPDMFERLRGNP